MYKWLIPLGIVVVLGVWIVGSANGLVAKDETVNQTYAQVQNVMQRQAELIPNLVETVKAYAKFEQETFTKVSEARAKAGGVINIDPKQIANNPELQKQFLDAQNTLAGSLGRLLALNEKYPELKADKGFQDLRTELTGSINRVTVERRKNQLAVQEYNQAIRTFPSVIVARTLGYATKPYFTADADAQRAPKVNFN